MIGLVVRANAGIEDIVSSRGFSGLVGGHICTRRAPNTALHLTVMSLASAHYIDARDSTFNHIERDQYIVNLIIDDAIRPERCMYSSGSYVHGQLNIS
jgi:hypothetical protein